MADSIHETYDEPFQPVPETVAGLNYHIDDTNTVTIQIKLVVEGWVYMQCDCQAGT